jgi:hypothetical protein
MASKTSTATGSNATETAASAKPVSGLYKKILQVQKQMDAVPKRGFNAFHKYHYATEADILTVKETLNANGLVVLPTTLKQETGFKPDGKSWASVTLLFRVIDTDNGDSIESEFTGYAEDNFDKAIYKATTGANKYFYLKFFGIATEDDPEREDAAPTGRGHYSGNNASVKSFTPSRQQNAPEKRAAEATSSTATSEIAQRNQALVNANKILALQKQYGLSNEEVLLFGEIDSIKTLAEEGKAEQLAEAYTRLANHVRLQKAI